MKTFFKVVGIVALVFVVIVAGFAIMLNSGMSATKNLQINSVNISGLADGSPRAPITRAGSPTR
jgi:hypothetical protein